MGSIWHLCASWRPAREAGHQDGARTAAAGLGARSRRPAHRRAPRRLGPVRLVSAIGAALTLGVGVCAGTAYAVFTATASGSGNAVVGQFKAVDVLHATGDPASNLYPGTSAPLRLTITSPNSRAVTITSISQDGAVSVVGGTACTSGNSGVFVPPTSSLNITLTPGVHSFTLPAGASMAASSFTGCQGAVFEVPLTVKVKT